MIVRMKELLLFTLSSSVDETVQRLGQLGVVDIKQINPPAGELLDRRLKAVEDTRRAISILEKHISKKSPHSSDRIRYASKDPQRMTDRILTSVNLKLQCQKKLESLLSDLAWYETWGEQVDTKDFAYLRTKGIYIRLYLADKSQVPALSEGHCVLDFPEYGGKVPIALFSSDESEKLSLQEEAIPLLPLKEIRQQIHRKKRQLKEINFFLEDQASNIDLLHDYLTLLKNRFGIQEVMDGMGEVKGKIKYLRGYIPRKEVEAFIPIAQQNNWGYQISEPEDPEEVPVYIKNPKWISIINPVMKFIDIVPGYKEVDVSIYFLIAFALFFAMLVGDAGYGAIFLLLAFLLRKKIPGQLRFLIYVLSGATIVWGVLSGTYFGAEQIAAIPFFSDLIIENIASFGVDNISFMMHLSFLIGAIHLTIAHSIRLVQFSNSIKALSELGWILLMWGLFFVTENLVLGKELPVWNNWLFIAGAALVGFFSMESKNLFRSMLASLSNLPLSLISGFSDIVSYVRLFAVGMATAAVAASFNNMVIPAGGIADMGILDLLMAAVGLILGHGLNIVLALMAVMVHGIRLNMLEFAGHLGVQFSGEAYRPFSLTPFKEEVENEEVTSS